MSGYYPESYLRKRQREQGVRRLIIGLCTLAVLAVIGIPVSIFAVKHFATLRAGTDDPALAREKQQLEQQSKIENLPDQQWAANAAQAANGGQDTKVPRLGELEYAASFPQLSVGLEASAAAPPADDAASALDGGAELTDPALTAVPGEEAAGGVNPDPVTALSPGGGADATPGSSGPGDAGSKSAAGATGDNSGQDKYQRKPEQEAGAGSQADKDQAAKDKAAKDKAAKDKAAKDKAAKDKAAKEKAAREKKERERQKAAEAEKAEKAEKDAKADNGDKAAKPKAGDDVVLVVYGGSFHSKEDADKAKAGLSALGLTGTVISDEVGHRLLIMQTDDLKSANALVKKLQSNGFGSAYMTRKRK